MELSIIEHIRSPFTFKTDEGHVGHLSLVERVTAVALSILSLGLAVVGGPLSLVASPIIFYGFTAILKMVHSQDTNRAVNLSQQSHSNGALAAFEKEIEPYFIHYSIRGDGACCPRSIARGLMALRHEKGDETEQAKQIRAAVVAEMRANRDTYIDFFNFNEMGIKGDTPEDQFENYLKVMAEPKTYFDQYEVVAAAKALKICIKIYRPEPGSQKLENGTLEPFAPENVLFKNEYAANGTVYLHYNGTNHYELLIPKSLPPSA